MASELFPSVAELATTMPDSATKIAERDTMESAPFAGRHAPEAPVPTAVLPVPRAAMLALPRSSNRSFLCSRLPKTSP